MAKKKKTTLPLTHLNWMPPDRDPKFKIGDRVSVVSESFRALMSEQNGRVYGVIYRIEPVHRGYWYDVHFDGQVSHHTIREDLLARI